MGDDIMRRFAPSNALTIYRDRYEFQFGRVLVCVITPPFVIPNIGLEWAERMFDEVWGAIPAVISVAEMESRAQLPEFWEAHDEAGTAGDRMAVWWVCIDPISGLVDYEIGQNFDSIHQVLKDLPELDEDSNITVTRAPDESLRIRR
jgi:hypothetical protein